MNTPYSVFLLYRFFIITLLSFGLLTQAACTSTGGGWLDSREEDLSKIYVNPFGSAVNLQFPDSHSDAPQVLTRAIEQQLLEENRLQTGYGIHSLTLQGMILSYQNDVLEVQGELYDDDKFLVYSRVKRRIESGDDWGQGLDLIVEQMLDELMRKMSEAPQVDYMPYYAVTPGYFVVDDRYYYGNDYYNSYYYNAYYADWGRWRHYPRHHHDDHDDHHQQPPAPIPNDKPKPKPHWVSGAIIEALPRSSHIYEENTRKREQIRQQNQPPTSTGVGGYWRGDRSRNSSDYSVPSSSIHDDRPSAPQRFEPSFNRSPSPTRPTPSYTPPQSHQTEHRPSPPPPSPAPTPVRSAPAPRTESTAPTSRSSSGSSGASRAVPGSHKNKGD